MKNPLSIDVLISTYGDRIYQVDNVLHEKKENVHYIICHQCYDSYPPTDSLLCRPDVTYIKSNTKGVAKSRNILIEKSQADIIYFCDDDIVLGSDFIRILTDAHMRYADAVILFNIIDESGAYRKSYPKISVVKSRLNILSVGTIEISIKRNDCSSRFPEDIGAGTSLPIGDEAVFLAGVLDDKKSIRYVPETIAMHPRESTGLDVSIASIYSRGVVFKRVYGAFSLPLALLFVFKRRNLFKVKNGFFYALKVFFRGAFYGR